MNSPQQLLSTLRTAALPDQLSLRDWDALIPYSQELALAGQVCHIASRSSAVGILPPQVATFCEAMRSHATSQSTLIRWEVNRLQRVLSEKEIPFVLLKGAAYEHLALPFTAGRVSRDVDILVRKDDLASAEHQLLASGWKQAERTTRNTEYYRKWLHEVPPFIFPNRKIQVDLHHSILPLTDPIHLDPELLWQGLVEIDTGVYVLAESDRVIHSLIHLFRQGDFRKGLRDLHDAHGLLAEYGSRDDFWRKLANRTVELDVTVPVYFGLTTVRRLFGTPMPDWMDAVVAEWKPLWPPERLIEQLANRALFPRSLDGRDSLHNWALFILSHWPLPRWRAIITPNFWMKRLPSFGE